jgi:TfoX/Sxy family transcriptional regulator of competence genes
MPHDPHLADLMRQALKGRVGITEKKMFGGFCWLLNGNMIAGVEVGRYMFRPGKPQYEDALKRPGAVPMAFTGKLLGGFVWVQADEALETGLEDWITFCARFVNSLPPK